MATGVRTGVLIAAACLLAESAAAGAPAAQQVDCDQLAAMPNAPMSVESCRQMRGAAQSYQAAAQDPSARRPGDESMSCADIAAELKTMQGVGLSEAAQQENATAAKNYQEKLAKQQAEMRALGVGATAAVNAAAAADAAVEVGSGGLVQGHAAAAAQQAALQEGRVVGERMAQERRPDEQRLTRAVGSSSAEMGGQLESNPRYARLIQLAIARNCHEAEP
jgi:hypothetical protein